MIVVKGIQYPNQLGHRSEDHQDVEELVGGAVYIEFTGISTLGELGLQNRIRQHRFSSSCEKSVALLHISKRQLEESLLRSDSRAYRIVSSFARRQTS